MARNPISCNWWSEEAKSLASWNTLPIYGLGGNSRWFGKQTADVSDIRCRQLYCGYECACLMLSLHKPLPETPVEGNSYKASCGKPRRVIMTCQDQLHLYKNFNIALDIALDINFIVALNQQHDMDRIAAVLDLPLFWYSPHYFTSFARLGVWSVLEVAQYAAKHFAEPLGFPRCQSWFYGVG